MFDPKLNIAANVCVLGRSFWWPAQRTLFPQDANIVRCIGCLYLLIIPAPFIRGPQGDRLASRNCGELNGRIAYLPDSIAVPDRLHVKPQVIPFGADRLERDSKPLQDGKKSRRIDHA